MKANQKTITMIISPTRLCDRKCVYCYVKGRKNERSLDKIVIIQMGILTQGMQKDFDDLSTKLDTAYQQIDFLTKFLKNENKFYGPFQIKFKKRFLTKKVFEESAWRNVFIQKLNEIKEESESRKKKGENFSIQVLWRHEDSNTYLKRIKGEWMTKSLLSNSISP